MLALNKLLILNFQAFSGGLPVSPEYFSVDSGDRRRQVLSFTAYHALKKFCDTHAWTDFDKRFRAVVLIINLVVSMNWTINGWAHIANSTLCALLSVIFCRTGYHSDSTMVKTRTDKIVRGQEKLGRAKTWMFTGFGDFFLNGRNKIGSEPGKIDITARRAERRAAI